MENDFLTSIPKEGENPFENTDEQEKETPAESSPEEKPEEGKEPSQEGDNTPDASDVPFHKHPRWQERERELADLRAEIEALKSTPKDEAPTEEKPEWFSEAFGDNDTLHEKYAKDRATLKEEVKAELIRDQEVAQAREQETLRSLSSKFDADIQDLKDEGKKFDENELRQIAAEYFPTDENGIVSMKKAYGIYDALRSKVSEDKAAARKDLAAKVTSDDKGEPQPKDFVTSAEARRMSWT